MRKLVPILVCTFLSFTLSGQGLAGMYSAPGQNSLVSLKLENTIGGIQGIFRDMQGVHYQLQGEVQDGEGFGTLSSDMNYLYFTAMRQGPRLFLTLIPVDAQGQPDVNRAQELILVSGDSHGTPMAAQTAPAAQPHNASGGKIGGPVGGQMGDYEGNWNGNWSGNISGTATTMTLKMIGNHVEGTVDAGGYRYQLEGVMFGKECQGKFMDPQTQGFFNLTATLNGDQMNVTLQNPTNGQSQLVIFSRETKAPPSSAHSFDNNQVGQQHERDSRLVGAWIYTDSYTSGEYSFATQWKLIVNLDGTYLYGDGRVVGGGPGVSGDSGSGGDVTRGQWRTINNVIHINTGPGFQPYARYTTNGQSLLMEFGDGSKQLWKRSN